MAYNEFCCRSGGSNLNAGTRTGNSTEPGTAADLTYASGTWDNTSGFFDVASGDPVADGVAVGDFASVYADGASVTTLVGKVTVRTSTRITISTTVRTGTTTNGVGSDRTLKIGGAWKGPNAADGFPLSFLTAACSDASIANRINFKNDAQYDITANIAGVASAAAIAQGYTSSYGDGGKATIDGGTTGASYVLWTATNPTVMDWILKNNGATGSASGYYNQIAGQTIRLIVHNVRGNGIELRITNQDAIECEAYLCNVSGSAQGGFLMVSGTGFTLLRCISHNNTGEGFHANQLSRFINCIADTNTGRGFYNAGFTQNINCFNCDAYNNTLAGIQITSIGYIENCNLIDNGGWGINSQNRCIIVNCGFGSGTAANTSGTFTVGFGGAIESGNVTYAANVTPWVDPANGDFRINLAAAKGAGRGAFTQTQASYAGTIDYPDIGAAQHLDAGGGLSVARGMTGGMQ